MKKRLIPAILAGVLLAEAETRVWTDVKGRKINAEYVSQTEEAVVLRLPNRKEVTVPLENLSRDDLAYLIEREIAEAEKNGVPMKDREEKKNGEDAAGDGAADNLVWDGPVPKEAVLKEALQIEETKGENEVTYSSTHYRIVADQRVSDKVVRVILESCELAQLYCESLPFGLSNRFQAVQGKYEIHTFGETEAWVASGQIEGRPLVRDLVTGKVQLCFEELGMNAAGRGGREDLEYLASEMVMSVTRSMIPELYEGALSDWFNEGLPNLLGIGGYDEGRLDFSEIAEETKDLLLGKSRSGQKAIFDKEIEMETLDDLFLMRVAGPADEDERRRFLGQCVLLMGYLVYLDDGGKATGLRDGLKFLSEFEKSFPKEIRYSTQEELERKKAELLERRNNMEADMMKKIRRGRSLDEMQKDLAAAWAPFGLRLIFPQDGQ
jgi:hypothetical protein